MKGAGMTEAQSVQKRRDDPEHEDHTPERHPPIDWKVIAPRWFLLSTISMLFLFVGWLLGVNKSLNDDRIEWMGRYQSDARWELLARHTEELSELRRAVRRHEDQLEKLAGLAEDVRVLRRIAEQTRKRGSGGYGLGEER